MAATGEVPDGMNKDQQNDMKKVLNNIQNAVGGSIPEEKKKQ